MAGNTISVTLKVAGDNNSFRDLAGNARALGEALRAGIRPAEQLRTSLINFNQVQQLMRNVADSVQGLSAVVDDLAEAYRVQRQAETQLETVMRQRMGANDEMIQSVKDLCSAQQQIGVIGDEVQLAGAQQLATFLSQKSALDTLIPAMNNLAAQQRGIGATGSDMVSIANLMGKAMQGQTSALRRVGITFTEAQEKAVKYGSETQRAAALAEIITANVGEMNAALAKTDAGRAAQMANAMGDLKEQVGAMVAAWQPFTSTASQIVTTTANIGRFGQTIGGAVTAVVRGTGSMRFLRIATEQTSTAMRILGATMRMAFVGIGIFAAIEGISWLIRKLCDASEEAGDAVETLSDRLRREIQAVDADRAALTANIARLKEFNGSKAEERKLVEEMNGVYGRTMGYFSSVSSWYRALVANSKAYCDQMVTEARTRALANQIAENQGKIDRIRYNDDGTSRKYSTAPNVRRTSVPRVTNTGETVWEEKSSVSPSDYDKAAGEIRSLEAINARLKERMEREMRNTPTMPVRGSSTAPNLTATGSGRGGSGSADDPKEQTEKARLQALINDELKKAGQELTEAELEESRKRVKGWQEEIAAIEAREKAILEDPPVPETAPDVSAITTWRQLDAARQYWSERLRDAAVADRAAIQSEIDKIEELAKAWELPMSPTAERDAEIRRILDEGRNPLKSMGDPLAKISKEQASERLGVINNLLGGMDGDLTEGERKGLEDLARRYEEYANKATLSLDTVKSGWSSVKGVGNGLQSMKDTLEGEGNAWQKMTGFVDGFISTFEGMKGVIEMIQTVTQVTRLMTGATTAASAAKQAAAASETAASGEVTTANVAEAASGAMAANAKIPIAGIALGAAAVAAIIALMSSLPKFATGGIAFGATAGVFGEYPGARNNPEVVAPLDRLRSLIFDGDGAGGGQTVILRARGEDLEAVYNLRQRRRSRT